MKAVHGYFCTSFANFFIIQYIYKISVELFSFYYECIRILLWTFSTASLIEMANNMFTQTTYVKFFKVGTFGEDSNFVLIGWYSGGSRGSTIF